MEFTQTMEHVIKELAVIRKVYAKAFSESFVQESFSPNEVNILIFLARNPSLNTGRDLSICLDVSKGLICRSVDALIKKEMITARDDPDDRRIQRLVLTKKADTRDISHGRLIFRRQSDGLQDVVMALKLL